MDAEVEEFELDLMKRRRLMCIDRIEEARQFSIREVIEFLKKMIANFTTGTVKYSTKFAENSLNERLACDNLILGSLIHSLASRGLWLLPEAPYRGISLRQIAKHVRELEILYVCEQMLFYTFVADFAPAYGWMGIEFIFCSNFGH